MNRAPSEHPLPFVENPVDEVYNLDCHPDVQQSAIYSDILFHSIGEPSLGIVLTSECDIEKHGPENYVLLARLAPVLEIFSYWLIEKNHYTEDEVLGKAPIAREKTKRKGVIKNFAKTYLHNEAFAYYFLPGLEGKFTHSFICCEITECIAMKDLKAENKICVLRSPFREAVPSYYSAYIGRIGTPRYKDEFLLGILDQICPVRDN